MAQAANSLSTTHSRNPATMPGGDLVDIYRALSITHERLAIPIAFLGFLQQVVLLLWKFLNAGMAIH